MLKLEALFPAKVTSIGAGILAALAWLAFCTSCNMVGVLFFYGLLDLGVVQYLMQ